MCSGQVLWKLLQFHSVHMQIVLATAAPDKFPEAVEEAGLPPVDNPAIRQLFNMETRLKTIAPKSERRQGSSLSYPTCRRKSNKVICFKVYSSTFGSIRRSANYLSFIQGVRVIIKIIKNECAPLLFANVFLDFAIICDINISDSLNVCRSHFSSFLTEAKEIIIIILISLTEAIFPHPARTIIQTTKI